MLSPTQVEEHVNVDSKATELDEWITQYMEDNADDFQRSHTITLDENPGLPVLHRLQEIAISDHWKNMEWKISDDDNTVELFFFAS